MSVQLRSLEIGTRFRFAAYEPGEAGGGPATLVEKTLGRAMIRYDRAAVAETRTFQSRNRKTGEQETRTITVRHDDLEPCALGADVEVI